MSLVPGIFLGVSPRPLQKIKLTARMQHALRLLQMPRADLKRYLEEEIDSNPLLDRLLETDGFSATQDFGGEERTVFEPPADTQP